jgi:hypothetical protein
MIDEISEQLSLKRIYKSLEDSWNSSLHFYKSQLGIADTKNSQLIEALQTIEQSFTVRIKELSEIFEKKQDRETNLLKKIDLLSIQIEEEIKLRKNLEEDNNQISIRLKELDLKLYSNMTQSIFEKQKIYDDALIEFNVYRKKLDEKQKEIDELTTKINQTVLEPEKNEIEDDKDFNIPVVDDKLIRELSSKSQKYFYKYKRLKQEKAHLENLISGLLIDIETKGPIILSYKENHDKLLLNYNQLLKKFEEFKENTSAQSVNTEGTSETLKKQSKTISELKEKCVILSKEIRLLIIENHMLATGNNNNNNKFNSVESIIDENSDLKVKIKKYEDAIKKNLIFIENKDTEIKKLVSEINTLKESLSIANSRIDITNTIEIYGNDVISNYKLKKSELDTQRIQWELGKYKESYELCLKENLELKQKYFESLNRINLLRSEVSNLLQNAQNVSYNQTDHRMPQEAPSPIIHHKNPEFFKNYENKLKELTDQNCQANEKFLKLESELWKSNQDRLEEVTKLKSEIDILRILSNPKETDKLRQDLGHSRMNCRESKNLLTISENELLEERTKRIIAEKKLKQIRNSVSFHETVYMEASEMASLRKNLDRVQKENLTLSVVIKSIKEEFYVKENEYLKSLDIAKQAYIKEKELNDANQKNLRQTLSQLSEIKQQYEQKQKKYRNLADYLDLKSQKPQIAINLPPGANIETIEIHQLCMILQDQIQTLTMLQDTETYQLISKLDKSLEYQKGLEKNILEYQETIEELTQHLKFNENLAKNPEILTKMIALLYKSTKALV